MNRFKLLNTLSIEPGMRKSLGILVVVFVAISGPSLAQEATRYVVPVSSDLDRKEYRGLVLDNGLKVLLVSDPKSDRAEASMDVHIGSGSDPAGWNGLAHFLEHMLFLGTGKYPEAGEYQSFIKDHGGNQNAYTSYAHTNYFFNVNHDSLEPALDRFSRFFIDPTFDAMYVERERSIVHSEYQARLKDEGRRIWETQKEILNPGHPGSRFSVGSADTLQDRDGVSVRERLIQFYEQWYSADIMGLAVVGRESLDTLEGWVREKFAEIPGRGISPPLYIQSYLNRDLAPVRLDIVPEKQVNRVSFQWAIPTVYDEYLSKPLGFISNLLGHEGDGSLLAALKQRGWAESLSAGAGFMDRHQGTLMVSIGLTEPGLDHIAEIGEMLFRAIHLIRDHGLEEWRFREQRQLGEIAFRFAEEQGGGALARSLASRLHDYPFEDVLRGPYVMERFAPDRVRTLLDHLVPEQVYLQVVSQKHKVRRISDWYGVRYGISPVDPEWIGRWRDAGETEYTDLHLPDANPYVPERLDLAQLADMHARPVRLESSQPISAWYRGDQEFRAPRANYFVSIKSSAANDTARSAVLTELLVRLLNDQLNPASYPAHLAGLSYSLYRHSRGMSIRITGFQDKQSELLQTVLDAVRAPAFDSDRLALAKADLTRELENRVLDRPSEQTVHEIYRLVMQPYWTETERLEEIPDITAEDVRRHAKTITTNAAVVSLGHGDLTEEQARALNHQVHAALPALSDADTASRPRIRRLGYAKPYLRTLDVDHGDSAVSYYFQGDEKSYRGLARSRFLGQIIESPFYLELRTMNRVGYLVFATAMDLLEVPGLLLSVQSPSHNASEIDALVQDFLSGFPDYIAGMSDDDFRRARAGLVAQLLTRDNNLKSRSRRYWREIDLMEYDFDSRKRLADAVNDLTQEEMVAYARALLSLKPRVVKVQSPGRREGAGSGALDPAGYVQTGNPVSFRRDALGYFPAL